jgi:hypothetical protein
MGEFTRLRQSTFGRGARMSLRKPLVVFNTFNRADLEQKNKTRGTRATVDSSSPEDMAKKRAGASNSASRKVRVIRGRIRMRVAGYNTLQSISPVNLIPHIAVAKIRVAAQRFLKSKSGGRRSGGKRRGGGGKKRRVKRRTSKRRRRRPQ